MEQKLNIAEILKNVPIGTSLYSPLCIPYKGNEYLLGTTNNVEGQI